MSGINALPPRRLVVACALSATLLVALVMLALGVFGQDRAVAAAQYQYGASGAFVIGDLANAPHASVEWWGAQWWKANPMSGGRGPASFKGFESSNAAPTCGQTWSARPGNSSRPPSSVPAQMVVIVAAHIKKAGSTISGDVVHVVVVQTEPGYQPNPGHAGRGTIVAQIC